MANHRRFCGREEISPFSSPSKEMAQFTRARHFDPQAHYQQRDTVLGEQREGTQPMPLLALPQAPTASGRWERQDGGSCLGHTSSRGGDRAKRVWSMTQAGQGDCVPPVAWEDGVCPCWCPGEGTALQTAACPSTGFCRSSTQAQCFGSMLIGMGSHPCFLNKKYAR